MWRPTSVVNLMELRIILEPTLRDLYLQWTDPPNPQTATRTPWQGGSIRTGVPFSLLPDQPPQAPSPYLPCCDGQSHQTVSWNEHFPLRLLSPSILSQKQEKQWKIFQCLIETQLTFTDWHLSKRHNLRSLNIYALVQDMSITFRNFLESFAILPSCSSHPSPGKWWFVFCQRLLKILWDCGFLGICHTAFQSTKLSWVSYMLHASKLVFHRFYFFI